MQKYLCVCFIDYTKALNRVRQNRLKLGNLNTDSKIRIVRNLDWEQTVVMTLFSRRFVPTRWCYHTVVLPHGGVTTRWCYHTVVLPHGVGGVTDFK